MIKCVRRLICVSSIEVTTLFEVGNTVKHGYYFKMDDGARAGARDQVEVEENAVV